MRRQTLVARLAFDALMFLHSAMTAAAPPLKVTLQPAGEPRGLFKRARIIHQ